MSEKPLRQDAVIDAPALVGARWWQDSVVDPVGRRAVILGVLAAGGVLLTGGIVVEACRANATEDKRQGALALQRQYGWSFGAATEDLVFNGVSTEPFDRARLAQMTAEMAPRSAAHKRFYVQTLFESPTALPKATAQGDTATITPLQTALKPIHTVGMADAFAVGKALADAIAAMQDAAVIVDLDGHEAVAFAAGAAQRLDPVFLFDNWPHPHGVVPAHMTLAAAAYYQPLFARAQQSAAPDAPAMFVLDAQRLAPYRDDATQFDNRWVARMPSPAALGSLRVSRILYVVPANRTPMRELDDLNDDFVADAAAKIAILMLPLPASATTIPSPLGTPYTPSPRRTLFSSGVTGGARPAPQDFGSVPIVVAAAGGAILGVAWSRSGTWSRGWGGG